MEIDDHQGCPAASAQATVPPEGPRKMWESPLISIIPAASAQGSPSGNSDGTGGTS
ncbi:hypothetical protein [Ancylobacter sp.]|uniref:hypothetical protein n=1 Tax=Ancylobacter sp. TaxID=1872567 RepID=UPI003BAA6BDA